MIFLVHKHLKQLISDASLSAVVAGFIAVIVGLTSSAVIVFQAAQSAGLDSVQASSWLGSLCIGMGLVAISLSVKYKAPILAAWSTAGAAILVTGLPGTVLSEAIGAFLFSAVLIFISGITGIFEKVMNRISIPIASGLLAGVLLQFSMNSFLGFKTQPVLVGVMFLTYLLGRRLAPKWTMLGVLLIGVSVAYALGLVHFAQVQVAWTHFEFVTPTFSIKTILSIGLPLFVVTMASQNLTGYSLLRFHGYTVPISPILTTTGLANMAAAFFGGFTITLAAITATVGMEPSVHPDKSRRYFSGITSGILYLIVGTFAATVTTLFAAFPKELVFAIAGFALLTTIANALEVALKDASERNAAFITFIVAASGITLFGIGSAFWGIIFGMVTQIIIKKAPSPKSSDS